MEDMHKKGTYHAEQEESQNEEVVHPGEAAESALHMAEAENSKQQLLRVTADFANYRRRMEKERTEWIATGQGAVIKAVLPVFDDIERALEEAKKAVDSAAGEGQSRTQAIVEGLTLVEKNMKRVLQELGIQEVMSSGQFDPHIHEALMQTAVEGLESGTIVQTFSKGYTHKGTVIRHAKVSVAA